MNSSVTAISTTLAEVDALRLSTVLQATKGNNLLSLKGYCLSNHLSVCMGQVAVLKASLP